ncbi:hypothetical protein CDR68_25135, partial [Salmonella enterica]|nr:hypothetical protein [Salmonella enterica]
MGLTKEKSTHFISFEIDSSKVKRVDRQNGYLRLYIEEEITLRDANNKLRGMLNMGLLDANSLGDMHMAEWSGVMYGFYTNKSIDDVFSSWDKKIASINY